MFIVFLVFSLFFWPWLLLELVADGLNWMIIIPVLLFLLHISFLIIYVIPTAIPIFFSKLILSSVGVEYRCLFKKVVLSWEECEYCGIETYKSDIKDLYKTGRQYIIFSKNPFSGEHMRKIDRKKVNKNFIKFSPVTTELCEEVLYYKNFSEIRHFLIKQSFIKERENMNNTSDGSLC